jgi:hypothetical protein
MKQVKFSLPKESLRTLYFSLIHPHLTYGILAWGNAKTKLLHKTDILQKRALRTIHNILKLSDLYQQESMLFMHDYTHDKLPRSFQNLYKFNRNMHGAYETRQNQLFFVHRKKSRFVDKLPLFYFPTMWNKWSTQLDVNTAYSYVKRSIKTIFLNSYAASVTCDNPLCGDWHTI